MNFKDWLSGYLEGKTILNEDDIKIIKKKSEEMNDYAINPYPIYIPVQPSEPIPWWLSPTRITCETSTTWSNEFTYTHSN